MELLGDRSVRLAATLAVAIAIPVAGLFYFQFRSISALSQSSAVVLRQLSQETANGITQSLQDALKAPYINVLLRVSQAKTEPLDLSLIAPTLDEGLNAQPFVDRYYVWSDMTVEHRDEVLAYDREHRDFTTDVPEAAMLVTRFKELAPQKHAISLFETTIDGRPTYFQAQLRFRFPARADGDARRRAGARRLLRRAGGGARGARGGDEVDVRVERVARSQDAARADSAVRRDAGAGSPQEHRARARVLPHHQQRGAQAHAVDQQPARFLQDRGGAAALPPRAGESQRADAARARFARQPVQAQSVLDHAPRRRRRAGADRSGGGGPGAREPVVERDEVFARQPRDRRRRRTRGRSRRRARDRPGRRHSGAAAPQGLPQVLPRADRRRLWAAGHRSGARHRRPHHAGPRRVRARAERARHREHLLAPFPAVRRRDPR